jgi:glc operon protein GlcG
MKFAIGVGILATIFCLPAGAQTINEWALDQAGAQTVLQAAKESILEAAIRVLISAHL